MTERDGALVSDVAGDILEVAVLGRHNDRGEVGHGLVKGFGIVRGAIASSIGHDSHNVCVIGCTDQDMAVAVNRLIELGGGFAAAVDGNVVGELALPIAGLMSDQPFETVEQGLRALRAAVRGLGAQLHEPFLQMAFLTLPVIPHLRITDKGPGRCGPVRVGGLSLGPFDQERHRTRPENVGSQVRLWTGLERAICRLASHAKVADLPVCEMSLTQTALDRRLPDGNQPRQADRPRRRIATIRA